METIIRIIIFLIFLITDNYLLAKPVTGHSVVLQILEKVSARISTIKVQVGEKILFDSLEIEIFDCKKQSLSRWIERYQKEKSIKRHNRK